jgi:hypothetical protein
MIAPAVLSVLPSVRKRVYIPLKYIPTVDCFAYRSRCDSLLFVQAMHCWNNAATFSCVMRCRLPAA